MCQNRTRHVEEDSQMTYEGDRLKAVRADQKVTQQELADRSGIDREKIAKIETGVRRMSATDAAYLAQGLGIRADDLVARPREAIRWRLATPGQDEACNRVAEWFDDFIDDALFLERRAQRYELD